MSKEIPLIKAETCSPDDSIKDVAKRMQSKKSRRIFVVDKSKNLIGVVTTVDLVKIIAKGRDSSKIKVRDIMTKKVKSVDVDESLHDAIEIMNSLKTFVCPIVHKKKLIGLVSYQDIISSVVHATRR